jgi:hypothetical protein
MLESGLLGTMQQRVFSLIHQYPNNPDRIIAEIGHLRINQVTGRRNELMAEGCVLDAGIIEDEETGKSVHIWAVPEAIYYRPKPKKGTQRKLVFFLKDNKHG